MSKNVVDECLSCGPNSRNVGRVRERVPVSNAARLADSPGNSESESKAMRSDAEAVQHHILWRETCSTLRAYRERVHAGLDLDAALTFARFVFWAGLAKVLAPFDNDGPCKVDSTHLAWLAAEVQDEVQERYRSGASKEEPNRTQWEKVNHKLDMIAGQLVKLESGGRARQREPVR